MVTGERPSQLLLAWRLGREVEAEREVQALGSLMLTVFSCRGSASSSVGEGLFSFLPSVFLSACRGPVPALGAGDTTVSKTGPASWKLRSSVGDR